MRAQALISNLTARGITLTPNGDSLIVRSRERLTDADREAIRQWKPALLAHLRAGMELRRERAIASDSHHPLIEADREQAAIDHIARLDAERREADGEAKRGYDFDCNAPSHAEYLQRTGRHCVCQTFPRAEQEEREEAEIDRLAKADGWTLSTARHPAPLAPLKIKPGHPPPRSGRPFQPTRSRAEMLDCEAEMDDREEEYRERERSYRDDESRAETLSWERRSLWWEEAYLRDGDADD